MFLPTKYVIVAVSFVIVTVVLITNRDLAIDYYGNLRATRLGSLTEQPAQGIDHGVHEMGKKMERFDSSKQECGNMFPLLNTEIDVAKSRGRVGKVPQHDNEHGFLRGRIHNGDVSLAWRS